MEVTLKEDVFLDIKMEKAVKADSPHAAILLGRKGARIAEDMAKKYGIESGEKKETADEKREKEKYAKAVEKEIKAKEEADELAKKEGIKSVNKAIGKGSNK